MSDTQSSRLRVLVLVLGGAWGCTSSTGGSEPERPPATRPEATLAPAQPDPTEEPTAVQPSPDDDLEALALRCAGAELHAQLAGLGPERLASLATSDHPSLALLATWERARSFDDAGQLVAVARTDFVTALTAALGDHPPPDWWVEQLGSATLNPDQAQQADAGLPSYAVGLRPEGDRQGALVAGPGDTRVRPGVDQVLSAHQGQLSYDLSTGRVELGPLPAAGEVIELTRARAGTTIYWASFEPGRGGFRFPLHASDSQGLQWTREVCGPDRQVLGGLGYLSVELVVLQPPAPGASAGKMMPSAAPKGIAVFTAESHGLAVEVFEPDTGQRTLAWSSDFWFARGQD